MNGSSSPVGQEQSLAEDPTGEKKPASYDHVSESNDQGLGQVSVGEKIDHPSPLVTEQDKVLVGSKESAADKPDTPREDAVVAAAEGVRERIQDRYRQEKEAPSKEASRESPLYADSAPAPSTEVAASKKPPGERSLDDIRRESSIPIHELPEVELREPFAVPDCLAQTEDDLSHCVVILVGEEDSGKYAAARYLACKLLDKNTIERVYRVPDDLGMPLHGLARRYPRSILIVRDALSTEASLILRSVKGIGGQVPGTAAERSALLDILVEHFSTGELRTLCFDLDVDYEDLGGEGKKDKARELVDYLDRCERIVELMIVGRKARPKAEWGDPFRIITQLQECLEKSSSYLILTVPNSSRNSSLKKTVKRTLDFFREQKVPVIQYQPPDLDLVLKKHLQARLGEADAETRLKQNSTIITDKLPQCRVPRQAAQIAAEECLPQDEYRDQVGKISSGSYIHNEVGDFYKSLDDEEKLIALSLSLLERWPESDFWRMHGQLIPALLDTSTQADLEKGKEKGEEQPPPQTFRTPKTELLVNIRARSVPLPVWLGGKEHLISHIEFIDDQYARKIRDYVKKNHPDFLEGVIAHLSKLAVESYDNYPMRIIATQAIGLISRAKWTYVEDLIEQWSEDDRLYVRAMVGHVLSRAYTDPETRIYATHILQRWTNSSNTKWQWTAASTYKEMRWVDLDFALDGLERMAYHLDLSPLKTVLPFRSHLRAFNEDQFEKYILAQAGASLRRIDPIEMMNQVQAYFKRIDEAEAAWNKVEPVYEAIGFAIVVIALDYPREIINLLCDWVNEEEQSKKSTVQLTGSLIWLRLANVMADIAREEKTSNRILELIAQDEEALDALAELISDSFLQLFPIQLASNRKSFEIGLALEEWARNTEYSSVVCELICRMRVYMSGHPRVLGCFDQLLRKRWQSKRMPEEIRSLAQTIA